MKLDAENRKFNNHANLKNQDCPKAHNKAESTDWKK